MNARQPHFTASGTCTTVLGRLGIASMLLVLGAGAPAMSQDAAQAAPAPAADAAAATDLRAVFIDVGGKVQWRAGDKDQWRDAKVNDEVAPGVEVRTGLRSHAALRMRNATVLLDAGTMFQLPTSVQDGEVLRTTAAIKHGRADFKVDKVGLSNDFKVVTPSTTLAVRGTEFAIATGALKQVEVVGARRNAINAIELKYALNNSTVQLSGSATSSSGVNHPAHQSAVSASPPVASSAAPPVTSQGEAVRVASAGESPASSGSAASVQQGNRSTARSEKASGNAGGSAGVVSRVQEEIAQANARAEQAIAILRGTDSSAAEVAAQRDAILALRDLAQARREEALQALADHESALVEALALHTSYIDKRRAFLETADATDTGGGHFDRFDSGADAARALIEQIDALGSGGNDGNEGDNGNHGEGNNGNHGEGNNGNGNTRGGTVGSGQGTGTAAFGTDPGADIAELLAQLRSTLELMGDDLELAAEARHDLAAGRDAMDAVIDQLRDDAEGGTVGSAAAAAIAAYESAIADLEAAVSSGASARDIAQGAVETIHAATALVQALRDSTQTIALGEIAGSAVERLASATSTLQQSASLLEQIQAELAAARADGNPSSEAYQRRERLGQVAAIYAQLVGFQSAVVARFVGIDAGVESRAAEFAELHEQAGTGIVSLAQLRSEALGLLGLLAEAEGLGAPVPGGLGAAGLALAAHEDARDAAQETEQNVNDINGQFLSRASSIDEGESSHLAAFDADAQSAAGAIGQLAIAFGQSQVPGDQVVSGALDIPALLEQLQSSFEGMADAAGQARTEEQLLIADRNAIEQLVGSLDAGARANAEDAIEAYGAAMANLAQLVAEGGSTFAIVEEAHAAVAGLDQLIGRVAASGAASPEILAAANASLLNLQQAVDALHAAGQARDAIVAARDAAAGDERASAFGDVAAALARIGTILANADERLDAINGKIEDREEALIQLAEGGSGLLSGEAHRLRTPMESAFESADQGFRQLGQMSQDSSAFLQALDGAQDAAEDAERSRGSALLERNSALQGEANASFGREATEFFAGQGDMENAVGFRDDTRNESQSARGAADRAIGHANDARNARDAAVEFAADAVRLRPEVERFGSTREAFEASAALRQDAVAQALPLLAGLRGDIARYDAVVQDLAARAGTDLAVIHAQLSAAASARAEEIREALVDLGASASAAAQMAETASTNAGRMFGRSVTGYLDRATLAYSNPNPDFGRGEQYGASELAQQANDAADRAAAHLAAANAAIAAANNGGGQGTQR